MHRPGLAKSILLASLVGCSERYRNTVVELPCGDGRLALTETVQTNGPSPSLCTFELIWNVGGASRRVDVLRPGLQPYRPPTGDSPRTALRQPDEHGWPVFVDPGRFSTAEYAVLRQCLRDNLAAIDRACAAERPPLPFHPQSRVPRLSSIRRLDVGALGRSYRGPAGVVLRVEPDGSVRLQHARGVGIVGWVVDDGATALVAPTSWDFRAGRTLDAVLEYRDDHGRRLGDDFRVERVSADALRAARPK